MAWFAAIGIADAAEIIFGEEAVASVGTYVLDSVIGSESTEALGSVTYTALGIGTREVTAEEIAALAATTAANASATEAEGVTANFFIRSIFGNGLASSAIEGSEIEAGLGALSETEAVTGAGLTSAGTEGSGVAAIDAFETEIGQFGATDAFQVAEEPITPFVIEEGGLNAETEQLLNSGNEFTEELTQNALEEPVQQSLQDSGLEVGTGDISEEISGQVTLDEVTEGGLGREVIDLTNPGIYDSLVNSLANVGITENGVGSFTWNQILFLVSGGSYTVEEILDKFDTNLYDTVNQAVNAIINARDGSGKLSELTLVNPQGKRVSALNFLNGSVSFIDNFAIGYSTGKIAIASAIEMSLKSGKKLDKDWLYSNLTASVKNPREAFISHKLNKYMLTSDYLNDPEKYSTVYNAYYQIYDGKFQSQPHWIDDNGVQRISGIDETGKLYVYRGAVGVQNVFGKEINNPTLHGNFVGPASPNNNLPIDNFDYAAFFHDNDYEDGYFHEEGDLKLISRLDHLLQDPEEIKKYSTTEIYKMKFTVLWFSYPGRVLSALVNQENSDNGINDFLHSDANDFFTFVLGKYEDKEYIEDKNFNNSDPINFVQRKVRSQGRNQFYAGLKESFDDGYKYYSEIYLKDSAIQALDNVILYPIH